MVKVKAIYFFVVWAKWTQIAVNQNNDNTDFTYKYIFVLFIAPLILSLQ